MSRGAAINPAAAAPWIRGWSIVIMNSLRRIAVTWALCALALPAIAFAASPQDVLASYDWSAKAAPNLSTNPPPKEVVAAFIERGAYLEPADAPEKLCAFAFADLRHTGNLSLVASVDTSGRMLCNAVLIIDKDSSRFEVWAVGVTRGDAVDDVSHLIRISPAMAISNLSRRAILLGSTGWRGTALQLGRSFMLGPGAGMPT